MNARAGRRLKEEVDAWAAEMRLLLETCRVLLEYFGTKAELKSWNTAIQAPLRWVSLVVADLSPRGPTRKPVPLIREGRPFRCSKATARIISPLAEIVGGPVAGFIYTIRRIVPRAEQSRRIHPYGNFSVSFADAVTQPLWTTYRDLAPAEWKRVFPARSRERAAD
jgi:hypothetical protein